LKQHDLEFLVAELKDKAYTALAAELCAKYTE